MARGSRQGRIGMPVVALGLLAVGLAPRRSVSLVAWRPASMAEQTASGPGEIGTEHPIIVLDVDHRERWEALCQPREDDSQDGRIEAYWAHHGGVLGDSPRPYLVTGDGPGEPIDAFLRADPSGRYVAIARRGDWVVLDVDEQREFVLMQVGETKPASRAMLPSLVTFGAGSVLAASPGDTGRAQARLVSLSWGISSLVDFGPGTIWSLAIDATGRWARAQVAPTGALPTFEPDAPSPFVPRPCDPPCSVAEKLPDSGLPLEDRWLDLALGRLASTPPDEVSWPERPSSLDASGRRVSAQGHELSHARSPSRVRSWLSARWSDPQFHEAGERHLPPGPLRWQPPTSEPLDRKRQRVARTTRWQGDCAVYVPIEVSDDTESTRATGAPERDETGMTVLTSPADAWTWVGSNSQLLGSHYRGLWRDLQVVSPLGSIVWNGEDWARRGPPRDTLALVGRARGKRYETALTQVIDEFVSESRDEPFTDDWPVWRGWVGFLNSIARSEDLRSRFVLSQKESSVQVAKVDVDEVCERTAR